MITIYKTIGAEIIIYYSDGVFMCFYQEGEDKVVFDGIKHKIELFEEDLELKYFEKLELDENNLHPFNKF